MAVIGWSIHRDDALMVWKFRHQETGAVWSVPMDHLLDLGPEDFFKYSPAVFTDFLGMYGEQTREGKAPIPGLTVAKPVDKTEWGTW
jgi:hypothetical protein